MGEEVGRVRRRRHRPAMMADDGRVPRAVTPPASPPFTVFVNGVRQEKGARLPRGPATQLVFAQELAQEGSLGFWRWFWGAWGIGTYRKDDQVDVAWDAAGHPRVAHQLDDRDDRRTRRPRRRATAP